MVSEESLANGEVKCFGVRCTGAVVSEVAVARAIGDWNKRLEDGENVVAGECSGCSRIIDDVCAVYIENGIWADVLANVDSTVGAYSGDGD